jgi:hypothetical protein
MRRPLPIALRHSVTVAGRAVRHREARQATLDLLGRLPAALARRVAPDPEVETRLRHLERQSIM